MAKKPTPAPAPKTPAANAPVGKAAAPASVSTPVRNTAVPPATRPQAAAIKPVVTHEAIARRAYEISQSGAGGSQDDNWLRAEHELRSA